MKKKTEKSVYATMSMESIKAPAGKPKNEPQAKKAEKTSDMRVKGAGR